MKSKEVDVCLTVTLVDGLVVARSAFHTSINYRSVVVLGKARLVLDIEEKREALRLFTNHVIAGRWEQAKQPSVAELKATSVLALPLEEVSAKVRTGPPIDDEEDYALPIWGGVVPVIQMFGEPLPDDWHRAAAAQPQFTLRPAPVVFRFCTAPLVPRSVFTMDSLGKLSRNPLSIHPRPAGTSRESEMASQRA
jgi:hypothetical protein